jgi:hypothetical protein
MHITLPCLLCAAAAAFFASPAQAFQFGNDSVQGSFDSTITTGFGLRTKSQSEGLILQGNQGGPAGQLDQLTALGDQGNLNYDKGDFFTQYLKGSHELLLKLPQDITFMARANWVRDWASTRTSGNLSVQTVGLQDGLADGARKDMKFKGRILDLWVSKRFDLSGRQIRARLGNQVISWGESLFLPGGINATNALDYQRLAQPGTQLKEVYLPAPMLSIAGDVARGWSFEAYVQSRWNASYLPPTGSYWSVVNGLGRGYSAYGYAQTEPKNGNQWGVSMRYQPPVASFAIGAYVLNYHDKTPNFSWNVNGAGAYGWGFAENRRLYGISANANVGDWALGTELSYRPRDAVALNPYGGCATGGYNCWVDEKRYQWHGTALLSLTPANAPTWLRMLGADSATFMLETVVVSYPSMQQSYNNGNDTVAAGGWGWGFEPGAAGAPYSKGNRNSGGYNLDFSWVYDGTLLPGWQVTPEVYFFHAVKGRTPNASALFMQGAKSVNLIVSFTQNPATWQFGVNYAKFWGGSVVFDQPYRDRDFIGAYLSRNL